MNKVIVAVIALNLPGCLMAQAAPAAVKEQVSAPVAEQSVFANEDQCIERLSKDRQMTPKEAIKRYHCQIPITEKIALADYVIDNTKDLVSLESQVVKVFKDISSVN